MGMLANTPQVNLGALTKGTSLNYMPNALAIPAPYAGSAFVQLSI